MSAGERARLGEVLEAATLNALKRDWEGVNYTHLRSSLRLPILRLSDAESRLGQWTRADRTIEIARRLVLEHPWGIVVEVLKHEMAHQYADEVLRAHDETSHGPAFRRACEMLAIDPAASGVPRLDGTTAAPEEVRVLGRIHKLLALAESPNQHEAELATREAQRLMLKHNLEAHAAGRRAGYSFRHLGTPTGRLQAHQRMLASILGSHFFVEPIWVSVHRPLEGIAGTVLEVCGTEANLDIAAWVYDFLLATAERLWRDHRRAAGLRGDTLRRSFLAGVMRGFHKKLDEQQQENRREGLVWVGDPRLTAFFESRYPRRRSVRSQARAHPEAFAEGEKAGRAIVLNRPVTQGGAGGRRLLGSGS